MTANLTIKSGVKFIQSGQILSNLEMHKIWTLNKINKLCQNVDFIFRFEIKSSSLDGMAVTNYFTRQILRFYFSLYNIYSHHLNDDCNIRNNFGDSKTETLNHKKILALDLGTKTGWAVFNGAIKSGTISFQPKRFEGGGMRYLRFKSWLTELKNHHNGIDAIYFEEVRSHAGTDAAHTYGGFMATLTAWCEHHQIPYSSVPVGTIKKFISGKGNASKDEVINAVKAHGFNPADDNEADAISLLLYTIKQFGGYHG